MAVEGRVALVTGASRGIGKQTCILLAQRGVPMRDTDEIVSDPALVEELGL